MSERSELNLFEQRSCEYGELCSTTSELKEAKLFEQACEKKRPALLACDDFERIQENEARRCWAHRTESKAAVRSSAILEPRARFHHEIGAISSDYWAY